MDQTFINRIVEAALLAAHQPLTLAALQGLFPDDQPAPADSVEQALETLRDGGAERGVELVELASGFRYQVQADVHPWVARLWTERQTRYTRATLETLALIAYRQPITRGEIEQVRGVAVSSNTIKALEEREWIRVVGHRDVPGKPALFGTTKIFLDYFGLKRLDELPSLSELKDIGELEPQLQFDGAPAAGQPIVAGGIGSQADAPSDDDDDTDDDEKGPETFSHDSHQNQDATQGEKDSGPFSTASDTATPAQPEPAPEPAPRSAEEGDPEAAPGKRAADENDHEQDHAVETTTQAFDEHVPDIDDDAELVSSEQHK